MQLITDGNGRIWVIQTENKSSDKKLYKKFYDDDYHVVVFDPITQKELPLDALFPKSQLSLNEIIHVSQTYGQSIKLLSENGGVFSYLDTLEVLKRNIDFEFYVHVDRYDNLYYLDENLLRIENVKSNQHIEFDLHDWDKIKSQEYPFNFAFKFLAIQYGLTTAIDFESNKGLRIIKQHQNNRLKDLVGWFNIPSVIQNSVTWNDQVLSLYLGKLYHQGKRTDILEDVGVIGREVLSVMKSSKNLLYIGTNVGVFILEPEKAIFQTKAKNKNGANSVRAIYIDEDLEFYRSEDVRESIVSSSGKYDLGFLEKANLGFLTTSHLKDPTNENIFWTTGHFKNGVRYIDFEKKEIVFPKIKFSGDLYGIYRSPNTDTLYLYGIDGLRIYNEAENAFQRLENYYKHFESIVVGTNNMIEYKGNLLLGTDRGLRVYNEENNIIEDDTLIHNRITEKIDFIHIDKTDNDILWLATLKNGIIKFNWKTYAKESYSITEGLSHNTPHYIYEDNKQRLWIPTNKNLNCLSKKTRENVIFTVEDGLPNSEFNRRSYFYDKSTGKLWLGGLNGYIGFDPDSINLQSQNNIFLKLTSASITQTNGKKIDILDSLISHKSIQLSDKDVIINLQATTNYPFKTDQNEYSYRIPEIDSTWNDIKGNEFSINRLPYGNYTVELIADRGKRTLESDLYKFELRSVKPFRKTNTFYLLCASLVGLLTWITLRYRLQKINERNQVLETEVSKRTQELQKSNKTLKQLFAILAHDLRNPMASLTDINDKIKFLIKRNRVTEIDVLTEETNERIRVLDESLTNILHWAMSESNLTPTTKEKLSIKLEINNILKLYSSQIKSKNLEINFNLDLIDQVYMNVAVLQTILRNIISNAIKFSQPKGKIDIYKINESDTTLSYCFKDHGCGMNHDNKNPEKDGNNSSGIGLKIVEDLCKKSNSKIEFKGGKEGGTEVFIEFPKI